VEKRAFRRGSSPKAFYSGFIDEEDVKWFLTDQGIAYARFSFFDKFLIAPEKDLKQFALQTSPAGSKVWFATPRGIIVADMPYAAGSEVKIYNTKNSSIAGDSVINIITGPQNLQWIGTDKGVSGLFNNNWLTPSYDDEYPEGFFEIFPITDMASDHGGDTLFVATRGAGVGRFTRNDVDGISGASPYAQWGPCVLPSDNVISICVSGNTQWYGTDAGLARHDGYDYMEGWTAYTTEDGLVDSYVQTIAIDPLGKVWVGTRGGISVLDNSEWTNYTTRDGLLSNNILCIVCDKVGDVFIGTDNGFMIYNSGTLLCFQ
jgi:ligand-binding sensor domain-containing protein